MGVSSSLMEKLRDPREMTAFAWLCVFAAPVLLFLVFFIIASFGGVLILIGLGALIAFLTELFAFAYIKTNAIEVTAKQLPDVYAAVETCCQRLGIGQPPVVYVMQEGIWNAFAIKLAGKRVVVLLSGALDSLLLKGDMRQVTFLVGHEIGHHAAGHLDFWHRLVELGGWFVWVALWYKRRTELTCDRIALYCTNDLSACTEAVANMAVGAQLAGNVNIDEAVAQWEKHRHEIYVRYRTIYSTHPPLLWRILNLREFARIMGLADGAVSTSVLLPSQ